MNGPTTPEAPRLTRSKAEAQELFTCRCLSDMEAYTLYERMRRQETPFLPCIRPCNAHIALREMAVERLCRFAFFLIWQEYPDRRRSRQYVCEEVKRSWEVLRRHLDLYRYVGGGEEIFLVNKDDKIGELFVSKHALERFASRVEPDTKILAQRFAKIAHDAVPTSLSGGHAALRSMKHNYKNTTYLLHQETRVRLVVVDDKNKKRKVVTTVEIVY